MEGPNGSNVCQQILSPSQILPSSIKIQIDSSTILPIVEPHQILSKICTNGDASVASDKIFDEIDELKYEIKSRAGGAVVVANSKPTKSRKSSLLSKILNFHRNRVRSVSKPKYCQTLEMSSPEHHPHPSEPASMDLDMASDSFVEEYQETRQISARPYHWPHDHSFQRSTTALVIIDMQKDFASDKGYLKNQGIDNQPILNIVPNIRKLLDACRAKGFTIYHTREGHRADLSTLSKREHFRSRNNGNRLGIGDSGPLGRLLIRGEEGHEIIDELAPRPNEQIIDKPGRSAFQHTEFQLMLNVKGIRNLIFCGVTTDVCVMSTMRDANDNNFDCVLVEDACAAGVYDHHKSAVESITEEGGIFGAVTTVEDVLAKMDKLLDAVEPESMTSHSVSAGTYVDDESKTANPNSAGMNRLKSVPGTVMGGNRTLAERQFPQMSLAEPAPEVADYIDDGASRRKSTQETSDRPKPPRLSKKVSVSQRVGMAYPQQGRGEKPVSKRMDVSENEGNTMPTIMPNGKRLENQN